MSFSFQSKNFFLQPSAFSLQPRLSLQPNKGFTLIEIIVTLVLVGILATVAGFGIVEVARGYAAAKENERMAQTARIAMLRISRELMDLDSVTSAGASEIAVTDPHGDRVAIGLSGTEILLDDDTDANGGEILIDRVASFQLEYEDTGGGAWTVGMADEDLGVITISLELSRNDGVTPAAFTTKINPRNNGTENAPF